MQLPYRGSGKIYFNSKEYLCDLYYSERYDGIVINVSTIDEDTVGSYLELPLEISCLSGKLDTGFEFTLLELIRTGMENLITYKRSVYTFSANYLLSGIHAENQQSPTFHKVQYVLSNIIEWGNESAFIIGDHYELIRKYDDVQTRLYTGNGVTINYVVQGSMLPFSTRDTLKEKISLVQHGIIEICLEKEESLNIFNNIFAQLIRLIEIASFRKVNLEKVYAYSKKILYPIENQSIEKAINIYGKDIKEQESDVAFPSHPWKWITLQDLITYNSFALYFDKHEKMAPIIELFVESFHLNGFSETRIFLNIIQALETYHARFVTNSLDEFKLRIENIVADTFDSNAEKYRTYLLANSHKFITLESRIADLLLARWKVHFDTGEIKHLDFPSVIAHTRHYYTHYDESIKVKHRVLSEEELQFYNRSLLQILEYYILLELGFPEDDDKSHRRLTERWGNISQDLEILKISRSR